MKVVSKNTELRIGWRSVSLYDNAVEWSGRVRFSDERPAQYYGIIKLVLVLVSSFLCVVARRWHDGWHKRHADEVNFPTSQLRVTLRREEP